MLLIVLDDDNVISDGVEKAIVANLVAGAAMNTARSVFNETDLMVGRMIMSCTGYRGNGFQFVRRMQ